MPSLLRSPHRSYSFPPWYSDAEYQNPATAELPDIDEDPFAHFISPIAEEDDPSELSWSAGIVSGNCETQKASKFRSGMADKWARYVKHNHIPLHSMYHSPTIIEEDESFMGLDDYRLNDTLSIVTQIEPTRGCAQDLVARKTHKRSRASRTLSGRRHSWREPSPDLWTVDESEEEEEVETRRPTKARKLNSQPCGSRSRSRVHFNLIQRVIL